MRKKALAVFFSLLFASVTVGSEGSDDPLVVHEWGTFTVLQDDHGNAIDGVNINEESLPSFVQELAPNLAPDSHELAPLIGLGYFQPRRSKGIARYYHAARMRMETPIIYLYPPQDQPARQVDVNVKFNGGWITEWYPPAKVDSPGYTARNQNLMAGLTPSTVGSIAWHDLKTVDVAKLPETDYPVWLAPRQTAARIVQTASGECEKYLFYRGVANLEAPLRVTRNGQALTVHANQDSTCPIDDFRNLNLWLVHVDAKGKLQYHRVDVDLDQPESGQAFASTQATFDDSKVGGLPDLRAEMISALVGRGLYGDEAEAMLNTWEASYFRTSGLRLFFTLPQSWTDKVLPLDVTGYERTEVVRAMIGRIELISGRQRELIRKISEGPASDRSWFNQWRVANRPHVEKMEQDLLAGRATMKQLGIHPPNDYQAYMELGRFRDALIRHEIKHPSYSDQEMEHLDIDGSVIQIRHPATAANPIRSFTITLPGQNRTLHLGEMEVYSGGHNVTTDAKVSQSSNYQGRFPVKHLVDGHKERMSHTNSESDPWIKVEFATPIKIEAVKLWNRSDSGGRFANRFNGAEVRFFDGDKNLAMVKITLKETANLQTFAVNYGLPR